MLTARQNFLETIRGGKPDRLVKQYEYMELITDPIYDLCAGSCVPGRTMKKDWGFTVTWVEGAPGPIPIHDDEHTALKDITRWKQTLKKPDPTAYPDSLWAPAKARADAVDRDEKFVATFFSTGLFERLHYLMGMEECMVNFYMEPEAMHELIDYIADWEIEAAAEQIRHIRPDALFHHDDWGSQDRLFFAPELFEEFFVPAYKRIYTYWKQNGAQVIIHHCDSYAAELVPHMIEMGVDVWQGPVSENNLPQLIREYGGKISFHGGLDNGKFDHEGWSADAIRAELDGLVGAAGTRYLIPGFTQGGPGSTYPGAYEAADKIIDELSQKYLMQTV